MDSKTGRNNLSRFMMESNTRKSEYLVYIHDMVDHLPTHQVLIIESGLLRQWHCPGMPWIPPMSGRQEICSSKYIVATWTWNTN